MVHALHVGENSGSNSCILVHLKMCSLAYACIWWLNDRFLFSNVVKRCTQKWRVGFEYLLARRSIERICYALEDKSLPAVTLSKNLRQAFDLFISWEACVVRPKAIDALCKISTHCAKPRDGLMTSYSHSFSKSNISCGYTKPYTPFSLTRLLFREPAVRREMPSTGCKAVLRSRRSFLRLYTRTPRAQIISLPQTNQSTTFFVGIKRRRQQISITQLSFREPAMPRLLFTVPGRLQRLFMQAPKVHRTCIFAVEHLPWVTVTRTSFVKTVHLSNTHYGR